MTSKLSVPSLETTWKRSGPRLPRIHTAGTFEEVYG